jgi:hypothetical protein
MSNDEYPSFKMTAAEGAGRVSASEHVKSFPYAPSTKSRWRSIRLASSPTSNGLNVRPSVASSPRYGTNSI